MVRIYRFRMFRRVYGRVLLVLTDVVSVANGSIYLTYAYLVMEEILTKTGLTIVVTITGMTTLRGRPCASVATVKVTRMNSIMNVTFRVVGTSRLGNEM